MKKPNPLSRATPPPCRWKVGQKICIAEGSLAGLTGELSKVDSGNRWLVKLDGLAGVYVSIDAKWLRRPTADEPSRDA
ncbi:MAG: hypothetical protein WD872_12310 [Pirellulaceae bacterium]